MSKLKQLQEALGEKKKELRGLLAHTEGDTARTLNETEQTRLSALNDEVDDMVNQIRAEENLERARKYAAADKADRKTEEEKLGDAFSVARVAKIKMGQERFDGAEKEMHDVCAQEARAIGLPINGGILYKRQATTGSAANLGNMIPNTLLPKEMGYAKVGFDALGIRRMTGLVGVNNIPVQDLLASSAWVGEGAAHTNVDAATRKPSLTAKALRTKIGASWLMHAMGVEVDGILRAALDSAKANTINSTIINGAGSSTVPVGILNAADVTDVSAADGSAITFDLLISMLNAPATNDANFVGPKWAASPDIRKKLSTVKIDAGSGLMVWPHTEPNSLLGYEAVVSTHMPNNLAKGTGTNLRGLVFGHWEQMILAEWAIAEMLEDKLTDETGPKLIEISFADTAVVNPKAFAKGYFTV